jgi:predicted DNA-binding transcriptional regulator YafY
MDRTERFYRIDRLIRAHQCVPVERFLRELEISLATFKRDIEYMRSRFHAPIVWDRERSGYRFSATTRDAPRYELPGLWFNASEAHALLTMIHLLRNLEPGVLTRRVEPLRERLMALLGSTSHTAEQIEKRIRILRMTARRMKLEHFEVVATALLGRRRLRMTYFSRGRNEESERDVSPQRLVHYRDNWYLDAWCHRTEGLRIFALDCVRAAHLLDERARAATARIRFTPERARWVSGEDWHPKQVGRFEPDGSWTLEFPYSDDRELLMDLLKHVPEVEVLGPSELKRRFADALRSGLERNK